MTFLPRHIRPYHPCPQPYVTCEPEILTHTLEDDDALLVLAEMATAAVKRAVVAVGVATNARKQEVAKVLGRMLVRKRVVVGVVACMEGGTAAAGAPPRCSFTVKTN